MDYIQDLICDEIAAGLIWRVLGSPYAVERWRGAHSIRSFAKFGRWGILDRLVAKLDQIDAGPFQASELPFFYMHARLWLLIALARMSKDYPEEIARYKDDLLSFVLEDSDSHVLMQHFAALALQTCIEAGKLKLSAEQIKRLRTVNQSPFHMLKKNVRTGGDCYSDRPESVPKPSYRFHLDYEFRKHDVAHLARIFDRPCWEVDDIMSGIVHAIDPKAEHMYDSPGREARYRRNPYHQSDRYHTYGQQLGFHALFIAGGKLLKKYPVIQDRWENGDPWVEWLRGYGLTREDGLWLSDGTDRTPLDIKEFLLERKKKDLVITGDRDKLLRLAGINQRIAKEIVVEGDWYSEDHLKVSISSALVPSAKAKMFARKLVREEPIQVWVPCFYESEDDSEHLRNRQTGLCSMDCSSIKRGTSG